MPVQCTCSHCGKPFTVTPARAAAGRGKFCSRVCRNAPRPGVPQADGTVHVPLFSGGFAVIDSEDAERALAHNWADDGDGYPITHIGGKMVRMQRFIMGDPPEPGLQVDHINRTPRDNRRANLRWADKRQQQANGQRRNATGYRGVVACGRKWCGQIKDHRRKRHLGVFASPEEAGRAYDAAAIAAYGEFARLNFPDEHHEST